jgi:hypothetical protein
MPDHIHALLHRSQKEIKPQSYQLIQKEKTAFFQKGVEQSACRNVVACADKKPPVFIGMGAVLQQEI